MPVSSQRLAGKTAVITGTASGQGRAAALAFGSIPLGRIGAP
jgi:NAD(P)-dependent dehydrogenase (short-subunit alcohol dehydrogenase family)